MSLLIEGMNMPKHMTMRDYTLRVRQDGTAELIDRAIGKSYDVIDVPTPHGRLIDADAHIQSLKENQCGERCRKNHDCVNCGIGMYIRIVENEPTIIEAEGNT